MGRHRDNVDKIRLKRLEWLGHLARMADNRMPKSVLFSWLPEPWPRCGLKNGGGTLFARIWIALEQMRISGMRKLQDLEQDGGYYVTVV